LRIEGNLNKIAALLLKRIYRIQDVFVLCLEGVERGFIEGSLRVH
jgi:hypothetical protein